MRTTAVVSAILATAAMSQAAAITSSESAVPTSHTQSNTTITVSPPLSTGHTVVPVNTTVTICPPYNTSSISGKPIPSHNSTAVQTIPGTGIPPTPTNTQTAVPTAGAALTTTQNSLMAMGVAVVMAALAL